jgi:hypothetical protein
MTVIGPQGAAGPPAVKLHDALLAGLGYPSTKEEGHAVAKHRCYCSEKNYDERVRPVIETKRSGNKQSDFGGKREADCVYEHAEKDDPIPVLLEKPNDFFHRQTAPSFRQFLSNPAKNRSAR